MKAIGITGFHKSGKTTLGVRLAKEISSMGYKVGVVKHTSCALTFADTDTGKYRAFAEIVSALSPAESEIIFKGEKTLQEVLQYYDSEIVIIEGFKREKTFPKIVCLRNRDEKADLLDGLEIFTASLTEGVGDFFILRDEDVHEMALASVEKAFKLPKLNCGLCGYEECFHLARLLVQGKESIEKCLPLYPPAASS